MVGKIDRNSPIPVGIQLKELLKMMVDSSFYKEGDKLPSINQLAAFYGVNKNTVVTVLGELERENYIASIRGKGSFVQKGIKDNAFDVSFLERVDKLISEAKERQIDSTALITLINSRFGKKTEKQGFKILFIMNISSELVDVNVQKLRKNFQDAEVSGMFVEKSMSPDQIREAAEHTDLIVIPAIAYNRIKDQLPKGKQLIKTKPNMKLLMKLKSTNMKKAKIAVIASTQSIAQNIARLFTDEELFRPKIAIGMDEAEKYKKDIREMNSIIVCLSAREALEKLKLRDMPIFFLSDYIDDESLKNIKDAVNSTRTEK